MPPKTAFRWTIVPTILSILLNHDEKKERHARTITKKSQLTAARIARLVLVLTSFSAVVTLLLSTSAAVSSSPRRLSTLNSNRDAEDNEAIMPPRRRTGIKAIMPPRRRIIFLDDEDETEKSLLQQQQQTQQQLSHKGHDVQEHQSLPLTQTEAKIIRVPPTCQVQNIEGRTFDRIHFLHMRKAGGTALRMYFKKLEKKHKIPVHVDEGPEIPEKPGDYNNTFYVTVIREPVARSISQYKFDQRWDCQSQLKRIAPKGNFVPSNENQINSFEDFVRNPSRSHPEIRGPLWICSSNCYARWATGVLYPNESNVSNEVLLRQARDVLSQYNLILVQEWMKDADYRKAVSSLFRMKLGSSERFAQCARQSRAANDQVPLVMANKTLQELKDNNKVDSALFSELTSSCEYDKSSFQPLQYRSPVNDDGPKTT